jgi:PilZ domain-containing protein
MSDNRVAPRHKVLKRGSITFSGGAIDCTVRNLSSSGASLEVASPVGLPDSFTLVIEADQFTRRCHPVWSTPKRIGVAFD